MEDKETKRRQVQKMTQWVDDGVDNIKSMDQIYVERQHSEVIIEEAIKSNSKIKAMPVGNQPRGGKESKVTAVNKGFSGRKLTQVNVHGMRAIVGQQTKDLNSSQLQQSPAKLQLNNSSMAAEESAAKKFFTPITYNSNKQILPSMGRAREDIEKMAATLAYSAEKISDKKLIQSANRLSQVMKKQTKRTLPKMGQSGSVDRPSEESKLMPSLPANKVNRSMPAAPKGRPANNKQRYRIPEHQQQEERGRENRMNLTDYIDLSQSRTVEMIKKHDTGSSPVRMDDSIIKMNESLGNASQTSDVPKWLCDEVFKKKSKKYQTKPTLKAPADIIMSVNSYSLPQTNRRKKDLKKDKAKKPPPQPSLVKNQSLANMLFDKSYDRFKSVTKSDNSSLSPR